jgi:hypothetical protein
MKSALPLLLLPPLLLPGCAAQGPFPSLAQREVERIYAAGDPIAVVPDAPDRQGMSGRIAAFAGRAREGNLDFERALAQARPLAARAGAAGSESWLAAQQAVSRAQAARAATVSALADLDQFAAAQALEGPLSPGDYGRLTESLAQMQALAAGQEARLAELSGRLKGS